MNSVSQSSQWLKLGEIIAYPTEGVWGLGCDPCNEIAIKKLLDIKGRSYEKGLILVGSNFEQFTEFSHVNLYKEKLMSKWPGPHTWLVPAKDILSSLIKGENTKVALRLSNHKVVCQICDSFGGAVVSTSANKEGMPTLISTKEIKDVFPEVRIVEGELGGYNKPSTIQDVETDKVIR
tara:strand:- start:881 stop:1414 length:534 start_codon:yes stop_codon:yes gene_type:complete